MNPHPNSIGPTNEHPDYWRTDPPDELDDAMHCPCGGDARIAGSKKNESVRLLCSNARCGRAVPHEGGWTQTVEEWNDDIREETREPGVPEHFVD